MIAQAHPRLLRAVFAASLLAAGLAAASAQAADKSVSILEPKNGATVTSPFKVKFGVKGMTVHPANEIVEGTGHHHLLINQGPIKAGEPIPMDDTHLHYGKGQTEAEVTLPPGKYKLTAQFANGAHQSYGPAMAKTINITVK
ncbi:DUF4399 domain-containing protein [Herbaspirillum robiniae]|uniref:DUF4399 domain-containing protein n=1 Tax=Herbaspirillum robiniae TaxID=2014887 RepID=A0A246WVU4_9BURK|nr:DUF4399 domain-containing protein [Herbaspirillum robiniae]NUU00842.1 DUF4399 domain-containing protein [Herbaspirillum robiniae]OWY31210.1 rod shape-determining protein RodA [Herbaspirillum robiniae]